MGTIGDDAAGGHILLQSTHNTISTIHTYSSGVLASVFLVTWHRFLESHTFALNLAFKCEGLFCHRTETLNRALTGFRDKLECPLGTTVRPRMTVV